MHNNLPLIFAESLASVMGAVLSVLGILGNILTMFGSLNLILSLSVILILASRFFKSNGGSSDKVTRKKGS